MKIINKIMQDETESKIVKKVETGFEKEKICLSDALEEIGELKREIRVTRFVSNITIGITKQLEVPVFITKRLD